MYELDPPFPPIEIVPPPTQDELLYDDDEPMETYRHKLQMDLLVDPLNQWLVLEQQRGFVGGNMFVYFSPSQVRNQDYKGPDVFAVVDVPVKERKCWVVWEEGKAPDLVIELLSPSTAQTDKVAKKLIYQNQLRVPEYVWYDPFNPNDFAGFGLSQSHYVPIPLDEQGRLSSQSLGLLLVRWSGRFKEVDAVWLRWAKPDGTLLPTDKESREQAEQQAEQAQERANQAQERANQAQERANQEQERASRLAERLRSLGIDPEEI